MSREKLTQQQLKEVVGGHYTPEAGVWVETHYDSLFSRAQLAGKVNEFYSYMIFAVYDGENQYSIDDLKTKLEEIGIPCADLQ